MLHAAPARRSRLAPLAAAALGFAAFLYFFDWRLLDPTHIGWVSGADRATNFLGWHFFRHESWTWPPGLLQNYASSIGASIAITDSLPLVAFALKPFGAFLPPDFNHLGLWIAACFILQGVFSFHLLRALDLTVPRALMGATLLCLLPFMATRATLHVPLASHFLHTAALWIYLEAIRDPRRCIRWSVLLPLATMIQPYIFVTISPVFAASFVALFWRGSRELRGPLVAQAALATAASVLCLYLLGFMSVSVANTWGQYGQLQMNLLAWFNSLGVGTLVPRIEVSELGQTESFMYLGAGGILVLGVGIWQLARSRPKVASIHLPLVAAVIALMALAVSHRVAFGPWFLVDPGPLPPWLQDLFNPFRSSGRLAWLPTYLMMAIAIAACARLGPRAFGVLLLAAIALNLVDNRKIRGTGQSLVSAGLHREPVRCDALPASVERVVFLPQVVLEDLSIAHAWEVAVCAGRQGQAMNTGALARTDLKRFETGAREAASWLDRGAAPNIAFAYENPATGARLGAGAAARKMGSYNVFVPGTAAPTPAAAPQDPSWAWPLDVDMSVHGRGRHLMLYGWTVPLADVRTFSNEAVLLLPVPAGLATGARLQLFARPLPPDAGDLTFQVSANGTPLAPLVLATARGPGWYAVDIPAEVVAAARGALRVEFRAPALPILTPRRAYPEDMLRMSLGRVTLRASTPGVVEGRIQGMNADSAVLGAGWSGPEPWGVWSQARTAALRLPLPPAAMGPYTLRFFGHAFAREGQQDVSVVIGGRMVAQWSFASLAADEWREARIPAELVAPGTDLEVVFEIARPAPPGNGDPRNLGLALVAYELRAQ